MTEPFVDGEGDIVEREQSTLELELRVMRTVGRKFNVAMDALLCVARALNEHGAEDMDSLRAAIKVS